MIAFTIYGKHLFEKANPEIVRDVDSEYSRIWVKEITANNNDYKTLQVDTGLESYIDTKTAEMGAKYLYYYDLFEYYNKEANNILLIGGAGYTYPIHFLNKFPNKNIDVVEIDKKMTELAVSEFGLDINNPKLNIHHQDGRSFLNYSNNQYDVILLDAFKGLNAPFELTTYEAMQKACNNLTDNGMIITTVISSLEGENSDMIGYEYSTYKAVFDDVKIFKVRENSNNTQKQNLILVGIKGNTNINNEVFKNYIDLLGNEVEEFNTSKEVITDNFAPIY